MPLNFPKVPFPDDAPGTNYAITYGGNSFTFDAGLLVQRVANWSQDTVSDRWRRYDYEHAHQITDEEAALLGIAPEVLIVTTGIAELAESDTYLADTIKKNLGSALVAVQLKALLPLQAALVAAQAQLAADTASLAAANANLAAATTTLTTAQAQLGTDTAADPQDPGMIAADTQAVADAQTTVGTLTASVATLSTAVSTTDPAAVTAAETPIATILATIATIEAQFA